MSTELFLTNNLALPLIAPAQAQKHVTHNEALQVLDRLVQLTVESRTAAAPPALVEVGRSWLVGPAPEGAWTGREGNVATFEGGDAWSFAPPREGWRAYVRDERGLCVFDGEAWSPLTGAGGSVDRLGINTSADEVNRLSVAAQATLLTHEGNGHRLKVNRAGPAETASLLFQTDYSGGAEIGLAGEPALSVKVSEDGANWRTALRIDLASGSVDMPFTEIPTEGGRWFATKTDAFTTNSPTPVAIPGMALTVTPKQAPCRMRISGHAAVGADFWYTAPQLSLWRDGTKVWPEMGYAEHQLLADTISNSAYVSYVQPIGFVDEITSGEAITYELRLASRADGFSAHVNRRHLDSSPRGDSLFVVEEWPA